MKKYRKGRLWNGAIVLSILTALETPFNTGSYALIFYMIANKKINWLIPYICFAITGYLLFGVLAYYKKKVINTFTAEVQTTIKTAGVMDYISQSQKNDSAKVISFFDNDIKILTNDYFVNIFNVINKIAIVVFTLALTIYSNWIFALIYLGLGLLPLKLTSILAKKINSKTVDYSESIGQATTIIKDSLKNKESVNNYNAEDSIYAKLKEIVFHSEHKNALRLNQIEYSNSVIMVVYNAVNFLPIGIGILMALKGYLTIAEFVAVQYSSGWVIGALASLAGMLNAIKSTKSIQCKVEGIKDYSPVQELQQPEDTAEIELKDIDFTYETGKEVLHHINWKIKNGERLLIQGTSGSGKSTMLKIISGRLQPSQGKVTINGKEHLKQCIGYVSQAPEVFADTVRFNVTLGKQFEEALIIEATRNAGLEEFINENGLDYRLDEDGSNISGGQKQRIEIARALLYNRPLLLVDEGTSALDESVAIEIQKTILGLNRTIIEVAHYMPEEVIPQFDYIYRMQENRLERVNA